MSVATPTKQFFSIIEAAEYLNIGRSLMYRLIGSGEIKSIKIGHRRLIPIDALNEFIERAKAAA